MNIDQPPQPVYRKNVAAVIMDENNFILLAKRRKAHNHWQFPQGGVDENETFDETLFRELGEELGTKEFKILQKSSQTFRYNWSKKNRDSRGSGTVGQEQTYFLVRFLGQKKDIKPDKREFDTIEWVPFDQVLIKCAKIRKPLYAKVLQEFEQRIKEKKCPPPAKTIQKPLKETYSQESIKSLTKFLQEK